MKSQSNPTQEWDAGDQADYYAACINGGMIEDAVTGELREMRPVEVESYRREMLAALRRAEKA